MKKFFLIFGMILLGVSNVSAAPEIGKPAPAFELPNLSGQTVKLSQFRGKYVVLEWVNHGCPFVKKHYRSNNMQNLQKQFTEKGVIWLSIASSAPGKQGYFEASEWKEINQKKGSRATEVLLDPTGKVGKALYRAKTTPHMFVIDPKGVLIYMGAIDDKRSTALSDIEKANNYVQLALNQAMAGQSVQESATKPYGCSVKY